ncbi:hypothetical protein OGAPHI_007436 [Ogataea philodendri]|uniref:Uncharacterized protein n=1 Tax=Ogataea philodendri TaxID=1378263 RepID=A0A9P8T047_9ASCO|nr:uncharacterized protein OGAPHI_007436 [Ogataea philodendri]KAH3660231.1 hypothetical protein OGAPHI_007436 [Ogataea philodendri]
MSRNNYLSSSPSKLFDQLFEEAGLQQPPLTATSQASGTGWTPFIDKVFTTNNDRIRPPMSSPSKLEIHEVQMHTPAADKSLKLSDFFIDTPTLNQYDLGTLLGIENDNKENHPLFANMDTPNFKTPLHELTHTPKLLQSTSVRRLSAKINTPSNFKTPLKEHHQSSPSTIVLASAQKQPATQMSPTPAAKSQFKSAPCQLVKSASSMEPVIGIFQDQKPTAQNTQPQQQQQRRPEAGAGKFQIIFTDMNTLKGNYGARKGKKKLARTSSAGEALSKRRKLVKYNSESAKDNLRTNKN